MTNIEPTPRQTRQRAVIRDAVAASLTFVTAQQLHDQLRAAGSRVGLATVYRTLAAMAASGELDVIRTPDGQVAYRTCSPDHHHHLICSECGRTVEVALPRLEQLIAQLAQTHGFTEVGHHLELHGRCSACSN